jgi:transposase
VGSVPAYPAEFRREAVRLVIESGKSIAQVASDLGVSSTAVGNWVRQHRIDAGSHPDQQQLSTSDKEELRRLRKENAELKLEREILRKAAAYFARETGR